METLNEGNLLYIFIARFRGSGGEVRYFDQGAVALKFALKISEEVFSFRGSDS